MDPLDAIRATYFQECDELLASLEEGLLALAGGGGDNETINAVFRAVHSVKGGAGAFGYEAMVEFAHVFETALDAMRSGALEPNPDVIKTMLRASDILADHVLAAKGQGAIDEARTQTMSQELAALTALEGKSSAHVEPAPAAGVDEWGFAPVKFSFDEPVGVDLEPLAEAAAPAQWRLCMRPHAAMYAKGHDAVLFLRELARLGEINVTCCANDGFSFEDMDPEAPALFWIVDLASHLSEEAIREVFDFVGDDCPIELSRASSLDQGANAGAQTYGAAPIAELALSAQDKSIGPDLPALSKSLDSSAAIMAEAEEKAAPADASGRNVPQSAQTGATIRVDLARVDRLIDLVGELVVNQAMLAQRVAEQDASGRSHVSIGLDELEQLTREIQDCVMAIRAQPVKSVFQRMPRLAREVASSTGKEIRLVMEGEATEVDKTIIERLSDPITHMLRNAIDHGVETPAERLAAGKPGEGIVRLSAQHRSGRIVIEVSDDGKGINRTRVRELAVNRGLIAADANLSDDEIDNLIFLPGFSTASAVSNISGRGVGMDVVKRSIQALGGRISISSVPGKGSTFTLSLPLTLAVLDGMVITAGDQTLVAPLTAIVETLRPKPEDVRALGPTGAVLAVRGAHVPLIDIGVALGLRTTPIFACEGVVLLVECEGIGRAALVADNIQGQRQVVIKSLEANYQRISGIAAATILGDGSVALIVDVEALVEKRLIERHANLAKAS
ncbi:chemotaxis protein CheA [Candidatus Viadribacter manganicus]|uniref:Chemotaxis protein CheA n=1 Tax=Candidatus Viadribacter manganicus TaxID=1759059 RepID=A0A1B1AGJ5_9PROT|nr:chemotaxis protein CheA [Candidatus Viadribacter manganicus]ANP45678.1 chemotaxis protein CheA [Candidatus Viadribacter manganicus]